MAVFTDQQYKFLQSNNRKFVAHNSRPLFLVFISSSFCVVPDCPRIFSVRVSLNNTHYPVYSTHLTESCVQMKFYFGFCFLLQLCNSNLKKTGADLWELYKCPSSTLKTDQWFLLHFFLPVSHLWQYFVLLACTVTWVALCEGLNQIFWESSNKQCVLVFLYSIKFFSNPWKNSAP